MTRNRRWRVFVPRLLGVTILLAAGCASPDLTVQPGYASGPARPDLGRGQAITLRVTDHRPERGVPRESGGEVLARGSRGAVFLDRSPERILQQSLEKAFEAAGFRIAPEAPVLVDAEIRRLTLDARQFTEWPVSADTGSTLDMLRFVLPRAVAETRVETDLFIKIRRPGWDAGFPHLVQKTVVEKSDERSAVEETLSRALTEAIDEVVEKAAADAPRAATLPVTEAEFRAREARLVRARREIDGLRSELETRQRALGRERRELEDLAARVKAEEREARTARAGRETALRRQEENLARKIAAVEVRETEHRKADQALERRRTLLEQESRELTAWEKTIEEKARTRPPAILTEPRRPVIVILSPETTRHVTTRRHLTVEAVAFSNRGIRRVDFEVNDTRLGRTRDVPVRQLRGGDAYLRASRDLSLAPGRNRVRLRAVDEDERQTEAEIDVVVEKPRGEVHIVAIGIDDYRDGNIPDLRFAAADASGVVEALRRALPGTTADNVELLTDRKATGNAIRLALGARLRARENREDTVFVYFSGHGGVAPDRRFADGTEKYLLPSDASAADFEATALPMQMIGDLLERLDSERVVVFADTCYSGAAGGRTVKPGKRDFRALPSEGVERRLAGTGRVIMTAAAASEVAQEDEALGHGIFTHFLLEGLDGRADADADGAVTVSELHGYVSANVRKRTGGTQNPRMSRYGGDEIVIRIAEPNPTDPPASTGKGASTGS